MSLPGGRHLSLSFFLTIPPSYGCNTKRWGGSLKQWPDVGNRPRDGGTLLALKAKPLMIAPLKYQLGVNITQSSAYSRQGAAICWPCTCILCNSCHLTTQGWIKQQIWLLPSHFYSHFTEPDHVIKRIARPAPPPFLILSMHEQCKGCGGCRWTLSEMTSRLMCHLQWTFTLNFHIQSSTSMQMEAQVLQKGVIVNSPLQENLFICRTKTLNVVFQVSEILFERSLNVSCINFTFSTETRYTFCSTTI